MLKIAIGRILPDGSEKRDGVREFPSLEAFCAALNKGSAPSTGKQKHGPYWSPFDTPRRKGEKPNWTCLVLDFDVEPPPETIAVYAKYERIEYQTASSTPEAPRWRIIIAVNEPIPYDHVGPLMRCFPGADAAAIKTTQIFWHRHPAHPARYVPGHILHWRRDFGEANAPPEPPKPEPAAVEPTMSRQALTEALYALDPDLGYDDWLRVGMALHHEYAGAEAGFDEWLAWSERGLKFAGVHDLRTHWQSFKPGGGITGKSLLAMQTGSIDDFPIVALDAVTRLKVIPAREFVYRSRPPWLVKGLLGGELGVIYGESTAGKTFLAVDIAMSVGRGIAWRDHRVKKGRVVWIAAEDAFGVQQRQIAYCKHFGCEPCIDAVDARVLLTKAEDVRDLIAAIGKADLIVVDTLARVNGGDENDAGEMGVLVRNCQALHRETGAFVLLIHHSGWNKEHLRGSSALRAAVDAEIRVTVSEGGERQAQATKVKGGPSGKVYGFELKRVELGADPDGDLETSCIVSPVEVAPPSTLKTAKLGGNQRIAWDVLQQMNGCLTDDIIAEVSEQGDMRKDHAHRALRELRAKNLAYFQDGRMHIATDTKFESLVGFTDNQGMDDETHST